MTIGEDGAVPSVTVLSYNVRSLRDDRDAVFRVIRSLAPDVAIIQEAPRMLRWRSECAALARRSGLLMVSGGRVTGANLVLSSLAVRVVAVHDISFSARRNLHKRGAALAVLELSGHRFAVAGTHLDLIEQPRLDHLDELAAAVAVNVGPDVPLIVGGDLNAGPDSATWQRLQRFGPDSYAALRPADSDQNGSDQNGTDQNEADQNGFTYSAIDPVRRIDGLFADVRLQPLRAEVVDLPDVRVASDHRPLLVEYAFGGPTAEPGR